MIMLFNYISYTDDIILCVCDRVNTKNSEIRYHKVKLFHRNTDNIHIFEVNRV
jgi:hypothetical protein